MSAIWTSGEPVSPSLVAYSAKICFLTSASSGTWLLRLMFGGFPVGQPLEGAACPSRSTTGSVSQYHAPGPNRLRRELADPVNVAVHLFHQGVDRVEAESTAQSHGEVDRRVHAVQVEVGPVQGV